MEVLDLLGASERDLKLALRMVRGVTQSRERHGDFIVARGAAVRASEALSKLITTEEEPDPAVQLGMVYQRRPEPAAVLELDSPAPIRKKAEKPAAKPGPAAALGRPVGSVTEAILALLKKQPMTSAQLIEKTGMEAQRLYQAVHHAKNNGLIDTFEDPADGMRKYRLMGE